MVKEVFKSVTPVGNCSVLSMVFSQTDKCHPIKLSEVVMMHSTLSSLKPVPESTSQEPSSSIWNQLSSIKSELEHTDNSSTLNNLSQEKKMLLTTSPEDITQSERKSSICAWTESENSLTTVLDFKVS